MHLLLSEFVGKDMKKKRPVEMRLQAFTSRLFLFTAYL